MATYVKDDDPLVTCPYNPAHRQKKSRLQMHITKCKKNYPEEDLKACPFNAQHRIPEGEFKHHLVTCPDKSLIDKHVTKKNTTYKGRTAVPSYSQDPIPSFGTENWDNEMALHGGYRPKSKVKGKFCDDAIRDMKPAERKKYYEQLKSYQDASEEEEEEEEEEDEEQVAKHEVKISDLRQPLVPPKALNHLRKDDQNLVYQLGLGRGSFPSHRIAASIFGNPKTKIETLCNDLQNAKLVNLNSEKDTSNQCEVSSSSSLYSHPYLGIGRGILKRDEK